MNENITPDECEKLAALAWGTWLKAQNHWINYPNDIQIQSYWNNVPENAKEHWRNVVRKVIDTFIGG